MREDIKINDKLTMINYNSTPEIDKLIKKYDLDAGDLLYIDIDPYDGFGGIEVAKITETLADLYKYLYPITQGKHRLVGYVKGKDLEKCKIVIDNLSNK